jgi:hypothetical protein
MSALNDIDADAEGIRAILEQLNVTQEQAARGLEIRSDIFRAYCEGRMRAPRYIVLALFCVLACDRDGWTPDGWYPGGRSAT